MPNKNKSKRMKRQPSMHFNNRGLLPLWAIVVVAVIIYVAVTARPASAPTQNNPPPPVYRPSGGSGSGGAAAPAPAPRPSADPGGSNTRPSSGGSSYSSGGSRSVSCSPSCTSTCGGGGNGCGGTCPYKNGVVCQSAPNSCWNNGLCSSGACQSPTKKAAGSSCSGGACYDGSCDTSPPSCSFTGVPSSWQNTPASTGLVCTDAGSGCDPNSDFYCNDTSNSCSPSTPYTGAVSFSSTGYFRGIVKDYATQSSSCSAQIKVDMLKPATTDNSDGVWHTSDRTVKLACADTGGSGCAQIQYCFEPCDITTGTMVAVSDASPSTTIEVCPAETDCEKTITYRSKDNAGSWETAHSTKPIRVDKSIPKLYSVTAVPTPFSPNLDGVKDTLSISFSTDQEADGTGYNSTITISPAGLSSVVRTLIKDKEVGAGAHTEQWNGSKDGGGLAAEGAYSYTITLTDRAGNRNSSSGEVRIDTTPPEFVQQGSSNALVELGDSIVFSATLLDSSGIDSVFVCGTSANCRDGGALCRMENTSQYRDKFSCTFTPPAIGTYPYYIFASDSQNLFSNASGSFRVRTTTISAPSVSQPIVDMQSNVRIGVNYTENGTYPIDGATCTLSGGLGGTFPASSNPYYIELRPPKPERIDFVATCSKGTYPSRSASGYFTGRDLDIALSYDDVPLAANYTNYLYAIVSTFNDPSLIRETADVRTFSISGEESFSGNMEWNGSIGRWVANFTPTRHGAYSARVDFKKDGIDGTSSISMGSEKSLEVSFSVPTTSLSIDLGSSLLLKMSVTNKGSKGRAYNVTLKSAVGSLYPVSFDGEPLSGKRHSTTIFVPADTTQEHIILVKGMEVSPFERSFKVRTANLEKPNIFEEQEVNYKVAYPTADQRKVAPDLDATAMLLLLGFGILYMRSNLSSACRQKNSRK